MKTAFSAAGISLEVLAIVLWAIALFLLIPPVPSAAGQTYSFLPQGVLAVAFFGGSRFIALRWRKHHVVSVIVEAGILFIFGMLIADRLQIR